MKRNSNRDGDSDRAQTPVCRDRYVGPLAYSRIVAVGVAAMACAFLSGCSDGHNHAKVQLSVRTMATGSDDYTFEHLVFDDFARKQGLTIHTFQAFATVDEHLQEDLQSLRDKSPEPDLYDIDVVWPGTLSDYLVDLKHWLKPEEIEAFAPELINSFTVRGRIVALPTSHDRALLYYRTDLLKKYGFPAPPQTWSELENMAQVIQAGERNAGNREFWGYLWQGSASEALACNALEWQVSEGGGHIIEPDGTITVCNPAVIRSVERAASWVGRISPPGVIAYTEEDCVNIWTAGNAAFMRNWTYPYGSLRSPSVPGHDRFAVTHLPAGSHGRATTDGTMGIGVSAYSRHIPEAVAALKELTSVETQRARADQLGTIPTRTQLLQDIGVMSTTPLHELAGDRERALDDTAARPSTVSGAAYAQVSKAYVAAVHAVLMRQKGAADAMAELESELGAITGLRVHRHSAGPAPNH